MKEKVSGTQSRGILLHTEKVEKRHQIEALCRRHSIRFRALNASDADRMLMRLASPGQAVHAAARTQAAARAPKDYQLPEVMIFSGFSQEDLEEFLSEYKEAGIEIIPLKAVLTPHNYTWSLYELIRELQREHLELMLRGRA
jgi:hypothetical protein